MARGGARPGAGKKKGKKHAATLERVKVLESFRQKVMGLADQLLHNQLTLANGQQFLYKIEKKFIKTGKRKKDGKPTGYYRNKKPELVTDQATIFWYIENMVDLANGDIEDKTNPEDTYYFITTKEPNNQANDSLLNRTFGHPAQSTKFVDDDGNYAPIPIAISEVIVKKNKLNE